MLSYIFHPTHLLTSFRKLMIPYRNLILPVLIAFSTLGFQAQGQTQYFTTADGAGADIYIKPGLTNRQNTLQVKNAEKEGGDPHVTTKTYLKFDVSGIAKRLSEIE